MFKKMLITLSVACLLAVSAAGSAFALTPSGTAISNTANATYKDINGGTMTPVASNTVVVNVTQVAFVALNIAATPINGEPGDAPVFTLTVTNNGNAADTFDLTPPRSRPAIRLRRPAAHCTTRISPVPCQSPKRPASR